MIQEFNDRLKKLETWEDFEEFFHDMDEAGLRLYGNRTWRIVDDFRPVSPTKVSYVYGDCNVGVCHIKYLYRYLDVMEDESTHQSRD